MVSITRSPAENDDSNTSEGEVDDRDLRAEGTAPDADLRDNSETVDVGTLVPRSLDRWHYIDNFDSPTRLRACSLTLVCSLYEDGQTG